MNNALITENPEALAKLAALNKKKAAHKVAGHSIYQSRTARTYLNLLASTMIHPSLSDILGKWERRELFKVRTGRKFGTIINNPRQPDGSQRFDNYCAAGLYFVEYASEILNLSHIGFFTGSSQNVTLRGAVFAVAGRTPDGCIRLVAGYECPYNDDAAKVNWSLSADVKIPQNADNIYREIPVQLAATEELHCVAHWADGMAEQDA